ncbi:MAG: ATP-binding protein [Gemmatimonadota bacterium]
MITRRIEAIVRSRAQEEPVLALQGPRAVGKTTLLRAIAAAEGVGVVDLDDIATREAAATDPATFVSGPSPVCIDEYQQVPVLLDAIKAELNQDASPGRFIITGSTRHDALPRAAQALTGRMHLITLYPFSQGEIGGTRENLVETLFRDADRLVTPAPSSTGREEYIQRVVMGGFPMAFGRNESARNRWFDDYVTLSLERDVAELSKIRQRRALPGLLRRLAGQTAQMLNMASAGESVGLKADTAENYTKLLEAVFLVHRLPAWGKSLRARAVATPKLHVTDSGLAARLLRLSPEKLARREATSLQEFGHLFETFVVGEVLKQVSWMEGIAGCGHWRTHDGAEVDLVIERDDGRIVGIEVKAGSRLLARELTGLRTLKGELGEAFVAGIVLYTGPRAYTVEDRLHVLPADRLWAHSE